MSIDNFIYKMENDQTIPGLTNKSTTRPLFISKLESSLREKQFIFRSKRMLEELRTFIWDHGKAQAQSGYNDDLTMALAFGLYIRDTALVYHQNGTDMTRATLNNISVSTPTISSGTSIDSNPWQMKDGHGNTYDLNWLM
jgi:hypothetical protein